MTSTSNQKETFNSSSKLNDIFRKSLLDNNTETQSVTVTQLNRFKDEMLKQLKDIENKMYLDTVDLKKEIFSKVNSFEKTQSEHSILIETINSKFNNLQIQVDKVNEIDKNYRKLNEDSLTQSLRIKNIDKQMNENFYKYDRMYLDNLCIPGLIGEYCKFKSFKDFIESTQGQIQSFNTFKEKHILDLKTYKDKLESLITQFDLQMNQTDRNNKDYTNNKYETIEKIIIREIDDVDKRINQNRLENMKYCKDLILASEELKNEKLYIDEFKQKLKYEMTENLDLFKRVNSETNDYVKEVKSEFGLFKKKFNYLAEFIKDIRFRRNLNADVEKRETKELSSRIEYGNWGLSNGNDVKNRSKSERIDKVEIENITDEYFNIKSNDDLNVNPNGIEEGVEVLIDDKDKGYENARNEDEMRFKNKEKSKASGKMKENETVGKKNKKVILKEKEKSIKKEKETKSQSQSQSQSIINENLDIKLNRIIDSIEEEQFEESRNENEKNEKNDFKFESLTNELLNFKAQAFNKLNNQERKLDEIDEIKRKYNEITDLLIGLTKKINTINEREFLVNPIQNQVLNTKNTINSFKSSPIYIKNEGNPSKINNLNLISSSSSNFEMINDKKLSETSSNSVNIVSIMSNRQNETKGNLILTDKEKEKEKISQKSNSKQLVPLVNKPLLNYKEPSLLGVNVNSKEKRNETEKDKEKPKEREITSQQNSFEDQRDSIKDMSKGFQLPRKQSHIVNSKNQFRNSEIYNNGSGSGSVNVNTNLTNLNSNEQKPHFVNLNLLYEKEKEKEKDKKFKSNNILPISNLKYS